jgi:hypothetical protein
MLMVSNPISDGARFYRLKNELCRFWCPTLHGRDEVTGGHATEVAGILIKLNRKGSVSGDACRQPGSGIGTRHRDAGQNQRSQVRLRVVVFEGETKNRAQ